ncbi:two-component system OmpR family sensor kinase [Mitsuaria sp. BK045]|uniref:sensor histidine kinase n=1 Tax=unclassified Roseateles TaxID=2626991 RepID=UPI0016225BEF|nr:MULTISPECIES: ATP-binding protein [unclassified Roseateles]MBB3292075.1 two-component system OmpR family sensor kinase [Mitsuaria sp. BK041]MBB3361292.1 two-component system OmpR family sensor kinase [Mitsuaria sp. BK045]
MLSFRRRLALLHVVVVTTVLAVAATLTYLSLVTALRAQLDGALLALAEQEASILAASPGLPVAVHEPGTTAAPPPYARLDRLVQIIGPRGEVLARSANLGAASLPNEAALLARLARGETVFEHLAFGDEPTRRVSVPVHGGRALAVQVAGSLDDVDHAVASAGWVFLVMSLVLVVVLTTAGAQLTGRVFGAVDDIVRQARRIGGRTLAERLPHPGTRDEIGRLIDTLNDMLARLEHAFEAQRRFTADASHELRSPLSRLRTELEITLRRPRGADEYVQALRSGLEDVARLTALVEELLTLARLDAGQDTAPVAPVAIGPILEAVVRRARPAAQARGMTLSLAGTDDSGADALEANAAARVPRELLMLVATNLVENAVKYGTAGGSVLVSVVARPDGTELVVEDDGPGLPAEERERVFERFYRGAAARAADIEGTGLGLALCDLIVRAAGGRIEVGVSRWGGARFSVHLPAGDA